MLHEHAIFLSFFRIGDEDKVHLYIFRQKNQDKGDDIWGGKIDLINKSMKTEIDGVNRQIEKMMQ